MLCQVSLAPDCALSRCSSVDGVGNTVARGGFLLGEGEEEGLAGSVELGDPDLAWGPTLLVKLQVWWGRIWFIVSL